MLISPFVILTLFWPYFFLKQLPIDVRFAIPFIAISFIVSFVLIFGARAHPKFLWGKSSQLISRLTEYLNQRQIFDLVILLLIQVVTGCIVGLIWMNLRLLFVDSLSMFPIWIWPFLSILLASLLLLIVGDKIYLINTPRFLKAVTDRKTLLVLFSFVSSVLVGLGITEMIMFYFRAQASLQGNTNIRIVSGAVFPFLIFDLILLFSVLKKEKRKEPFSQPSVTLRKVQNQFDKDVGTMAKIRSLLSMWPLATSFLCTFTLFLLCFAVFRIGYSLNDDIQIIALAAGYPSGTPFPFLTFSNVILGFILNFLYKLPGQINWEIWLFIMIHFLSLWALTYLILFRTLMRRGIQSLGLLVVLFSEVYFLLNITFTTVAAIASIAGFCLILTAAQSETAHRRQLFVWGCTLIFTASLIRIESMVFVLLILFPILIINSRTFDPKSLVIYLSIVSFLILGGYIFDEAYLNSFPDWYSYNTYTMTRSMVLDTPRLNNIDGAIGKVGWSANDLNMFVRWFFPDQTTYSLENLQILINHVSDKQKNFFGWILSFPDRLSSLTVLPYTLMLVSLWLCILLNGPRPGKLLISSILTVLFLAFIIIYLQWTQKAPDRILLFSLSAGIMFSLNNWYWANEDQINISFMRSTDDIFSRLGFLSMFISLLVMICVVFQQSIQTTQINVGRQRAYENMLADMKNLQLRGDIAPKALIVSPAYGIPWEWSNPLFLEFPSMQYLVTNWGTFSPAYYKALDEFQIHSLVSSLYQKDNVYLMVDTSTMRSIVQFIKEHYRVNVSAKSIYVIPAQYTRGTVYYGVTLYKLQQGP